MGNREKEYLKERKASYIYRKVDSGKLNNDSVMRLEDGSRYRIKQMNDTSGDENPYRELIVNNAGRIETTLSQMEQLSIFSNVTNYVQYDKHPQNVHGISVWPVNKMKDKIKSKKDEKERSISEIDFRNASDRLRGINSEILSTNRFNENSDLSMTYLGRVNVARETKITQERNFCYQSKGTQQESYCLILNVKYYWIPELANLLCPNHTICIADHFICYPSLLQKFRGSK